jgi:hypothetical protein
MSITKDFIVKAGLQVQGTSSTVSTSSGALIVQGGIGSGENIYAGGIATLGGTIALRGTGSTSSANLQTLRVVGGGIGVVGDSYINGKLGVNDNVYFKSTTNAVSTGSGALVVDGGVGIGRDLYVQGQVIVGGAGVVTTASLGVYGVTALYAGTDTSVSANTGTIYLWNTSTLQSITNRGAITNNTITFANASYSASTNTGAIIVQGGAGVWGRLNVGSTLTVSGPTFITDVTTSSNTLTGALVVSGGMASLQAYHSYAVIDGAQASVSSLGNNALYISSGGIGVKTSGMFGTNVVVQGTASSANTNSGQALLVTGGAGIGGTLAAGAGVFVDGSTATTAGIAALKVTNGGAYIGNNLVIMGTSASTGTTASNALYVAGGVGIAQSLVVGGNASFNGVVTFNGTATYVYSTNTVYTDNLIELHTPPGGVTANWAYDDQKDIGLRFHYYTAGTDTNAALVLDNTTKYLDWYSSGAEDISGNFSSATFGTFRTANIVLTGNANATSTLTGALQVLGGIGINGQSYFAGLGASASTSSASGQGLVINANGLGVTGGSYFANGLGIGGAGLNVTNNGTIGGIATISGTGGLGSWTAANTQALQVSANGIGIVGTSYINGALAITGITTVTNTTNASSTITGALQVVGGVGIGQDLRVGGTIFGTLNGTASSANNLTGGAAGSIPIQSAAGVTSFIPIGSSGQVLVAGANTATWSAIGSLTAGTATNANNVLTTTTNVDANYYIGFLNTTTGYAQVLTDNQLIYNPISDSLILSGVTDTTSTYSGGLVVSGGASIVKQLRVGQTATIVGPTFIANTTAATSTNSGALQVYGGVGIGGSVYAGNIFDNNWRVVTSVRPTAGQGISIEALVSNGTATSFAVVNTGVSMLFAGTDTAISSNTGTVTVWNTSTLQTITNRGATTNNAISITNGTVGNYTVVAGTATLTGALTVTGGAGVSGNFNVAGTISRVGNVSTTGWLLSGVGIVAPAFTATDTTLTGAQSTTTVHTLGAPSLAASGGTPTYSDAATLYIAGAPSAGANVTITNPWALMIQNGNVKINANTTNNATNNGALVVIGGVGVGGNMTVGGSVTAGTAAVGQSVTGFATNNALIATYTSSALGVASTSSAQALDTWSASVYRSAKYLVQLVDTGYTPNRIHTSEIMIFHDSSNNVYKTEYGVMTSVGELGTFDAVVTSTNIQLQFTPSWPTLTPNALTVKIYRTGLTA